MLTSLYLTALKLSFFQTMYTNVEEINFTIRKLSTDKRAKAENKKFKKAKPNIWQVISKLTC